MWSTCPNVLVNWLPRSLTIVVWGKTHPGTFAQVKPHSRTICHPSALSRVWNKCTMLHRSDQGTRCQRRSNRCHDEFKQSVGVVEDPQGSNPITGCLLQVNDDCAKAAPCQGALGRSSGHSIRVQSTQAGNMCVREILCPHRVLEKYLVPKTITKSLVSAASFIRLNRMGLRAPS